MIVCDFSDFRKGKLALREKLSTMLRDHIAAHGMSQQEAAEALDTSQPVVSKLLNGGGIFMSTELLLHMLAKVNCAVDIRLTA